ncbi:MAG: hypothetical protein V1754_15815, partial [Pseudomonadota bacterium]
MTVCKKTKLRERKEEGVALIAVVIMLVVIGTTTNDFAFNSTVDYSSAANARDELRAHYLARSAVNLSQLLLKVQTDVIDRNKQYLGGFDLQIADYANFLMSAFNSAEGAESLGALLGIEQGGVKGLGIDVGSFDLEMESLDGKLNINCGGGPNTGADMVLRFASSLSAMMIPDRYNRLFEEPDEEGQFADRAEVLRAIVDWVDQDGVIFQSTAAEDYHYNAGNDPYEIKNQYYDTVDELYLVRGVDDDFMDAFGNSFTVYGGCKVNLSLAEPPLLAALIIQYAATPNDPALHWKNLALLTRYLVEIRNMMGGFNDLKTFVQAVENPLAQLG